MRFIAFVCSFIPVLDVKHVVFHLHQDVIMEKYFRLVCIFLRKPAEAANLRLTRTRLLIFLAEQIPLSCLSSWKFNSLPWPTFSLQIQVSGRHQKKLSLLVSLVGVRNLHDAIKIRAWCLVPSGCKRQSFTGVTVKVGVRKTHWCHYVRVLLQPWPAPLRVH